MPTIVKVVAAVAALAIGAALAFAGLRIAGELHKQNCIEEAQANFPAVAIDAGAGGRVAPSFVGPRRQAVAECDATVF